MVRPSFHTTVMQQTTNYTVERLKYGKKVGMIHLFITIPCDHTGLTGWENTGWSGKNRRYTGSIIKIVL